MTTTFNHITVPSRDLKRSIDFYSNLGMELIEFEEDHHAHFENKDHHVIFTAYHTEKKPSYQVNVYFEVDDIEEYELRFRESVCNPTKIKQWQGKELHLSDPDTNTVILYQKLDDNATPPWQEKTVD